MTALKRCCSAAAIRARARKTPCTFYACMKMVRARRTAPLPHHHAHTLPAVGFLLYTLLRWHTMTTEERCSGRGG